MAMGACGLPLQLTQLERGRLRGDLHGLSVGGLRLLQVRLDRPLHVRGAKDPAQQLVCLDLQPTHRATPHRSHGRVLPPTAVCGLAAQGEVHLSVPAGAWVGLLVVERQVFERSCAELGCEGLDQASLARNCFSLDPRRFEGLRRALLGQLATPPAARAHQGELAAADLMPLVLEALVHAADRRHTLLRPPARIEVVMAAQRWMEQHPHQPLSLSDLCRTVHVSRRSLIQGFRDHLGMGPMAFLRLQRLHAVRQVLLHADPTVVSVMGVAARHGFSNHGHFATAYRRLFDEAPSVTLQRAPGQGGAWIPTPP